MEDNKLFSSVYVDYTQIPEVITYEGIKFYRIPPVGFNAEIHKTTEYMNTTYYSLAPISGEQEVTSIQIDGITYYSVQPEQPGDNYELKSVQQDGITYYAWVAIEIDPNSPEQIVVNNITYSIHKPEVQEGYEIKAIKVNAIYYASIATEMPDSMVINGVTYYKYYEGQTPDVAEGNERTFINIGTTLYYVDTEIPQVIIPDTIEVDGITYSKEQGEQPGENFELRTYYSEEYQTTYYAWVEVAPQPQEAPETIEVEGITYYKEQPAQPGENYELRTYYSDQYQTTYYAWFEVEPQPQEAPDTIEVEGITYYKEQPAQPGENFELRTYYSEEYQTTYYAWFEIEPIEIPDTIIVNGITYYKQELLPEQPGEEYELVSYEDYGITYYGWASTEEPEPDPSVINPANGIRYYIIQQDQPGENYTLDTYEVNGITYYAWIRNEEEPQPGESFLYWIGDVENEDDAPITSSNYQELAQTVNNYPSPWTYTVDGDRDIYILLKDNIDIKILLNGRYVNKESSNYIIVEEFDGYKIFMINIDSSTIEISID